MSCSRFSLASSELTDNRRTGEAALATGLCLFACHTCENCRDPPEPPARPRRVSERRREEPNSSQRQRSRHRDGYGRNENRGEERRRESQGGSRPGVSQLPRNVHVRSSRRD